MTMKIWNTIFGSLILLFHLAKDWGAKIKDHRNVYHTLAEEYFNMSLGQDLGFALTDAHENH